MAIYMSKERDDGSRDCFVSGVVTKEAKLDITPNKGLPKVTFSVNAGNKRFINCLALGNSPVTQLASCLEKKDSVFVAGVYKERQYTNRNGEERVWGEVLLDYLAIQSGQPLSLEDEQPTEQETTGTQYEMAEDTWEYQPTI